jgi:hypothetical protein
LVKYEPNKDKQTELSMVEIDDISQLDSAFPVLGEREELKHIKNKILIKKPSINLDTHRRRK